MKTTPHNEKNRPTVLEPSNGLYERPKENARRPSLSRSPSGVFSALLFRLFQFRNARQGIDRRDLLILGNVCVNVHGQRNIRMPGKGLGGFR